jgi:hypothetical protein
VIGAERVTGRADVIGAACDSTIGAGVATAEVSTTTSSIASVFFAAAFFAGAFFATAFFAAFLTGFSSLPSSATFFGAAFLAAFLTGFGSSGCTSRLRPSRSARARTRSACCSMMVDDCVFTPTPNLPHKSRVS